MTGSTAQEPPFFFVVGCGRSGTTLLRLLIDNHPLVAVPPESHFVPALVRRFGGLEGRTVLEEVARTLSDDEWFLRWGLTVSDMRSVVTAAAPATVSAALHALYGAYAARRGKKRYGDKTPNYVLDIDLIAAHMATARFVHVIRDGRDVALAFLDAPFGPASVEDAAHHWAAMVEAGCAAGRRLGPARYCEVRYEDLVATPGAVMHPLAAFLEVPFSTAMLDHLASLEREGVPFPPEAHRKLGGPIGATYRDWKLEMTSSERCSFERIAGPLLERLGYQPSPGIP